MLFQKNENIFLTRALVCQQRVGEGESSYHRLPGTVNSTAIMLVLVGHQQAGT